MNYLIDQMQLENVVMKILDSLLKNLTKEKIHSEYYFFKRNSSDLVFFTGKAGTDLYVKGYLVKNLCNLVSLEETSARYFIIKWFEDRYDMDIKHLNVD